jgi:hypothetical protein
MENQGQRLGGGPSRIQETRTTRMIVPGSWKFKKSPDFQNDLRSRYRASARDPLPNSCFGVINDDGLILSGETYFTHIFIYKEGVSHPSLSNGFPNRPHHPLLSMNASPYYSTVPTWSLGRNSTRNFLARLVFNVGAISITNFNIHVLQ